MNEFAQKLSPPQTNGKLEVLVDRVSSESVSKKNRDVLAVEEPLEIRLGFYEKDKLQHKAISITMRTPGNDFELAAGFLFTEGIIQSFEQIDEVKHCGKFGQLTNTVRVDLIPDLQIDLKKLDRHFYTSSSCGVCGKSSIEALSTGAQPVKNKEYPKIFTQTFHSMPEKLREVQEIFDETGGLHASALFNVEGDLLELREDVGRHNALDKLIGRAFLSNRLPLDEKVLFLSGRASFELLQKAVMAKIPIVAAVSAPSSLAVKASREFNITLLGFVRGKKFNVYSGSSRLIHET